MKSLAFISVIWFFSIIGAPFSSGQGMSQYRIMDYLQQKQRGEGELKISMDNLIVENLQRHILQNARNPTVNGYRIRIFSDSGFDANDRAASARTRFMARFENIEAYHQYDVPDFKVYVGDWRTKSEALKVLEMIKKDFPYAFIVPQNINISKE